MALYYWAALRDTYAMLADISPSSIHHLSRGHSLKDKQDRPIVIIEQSTIEVGTVDSVAAFRPPRFQVQNIFKY